MRRWSASTLVVCLLLAISGVAASNETTPTVTTVVTPTTVTPPPTTTAPTTTTPSPTTTPVPTTTEAPKTPAPTTTLPPSTTAPPTQPPSTTAPPTKAPATAAPVTNAPKTAAPATQAPTAPPSTDAPTPSSSETTPTPTTTTALRTATKSPVVTPAPTEESTGLGVWPVVGIIAAGAVVLAAGVVCFIKRRHMRGSTTVPDDPLTPTHAAGAAVFDTYTDGTTPTAADVDTAPRFHTENDSYMEEPRRPQLWESTLESQADTSFVSDSHGGAFDSFVSRSSTGNDTFVR